MLVVTVRAFASTVSGNNLTRDWQVLLLCKYPIAGVSCSVDLNVNPSDWGLACPEPAVVMSGVEPCVGGGCVGNFVPVANASVASRRQLSGGLTVHHVVPSLSVHVLGLQCRGG